MSTVSDTRSDVAAPGEQGLDAVTLEVLKNAFTTIVDQMGEQIVRTCHSFVIYCRDFSSAICDAQGNTVMQGSYDIATHVGTLHYTAKAVIDEFGDDINPGDAFVLNDPYTGGTHFNDIRVVRPIFCEGELLGFAQTNGHWADIGGNVPGSYDVNAADQWSEGLRVPPVRVWDRGRYLRDVARLIVLNTRAPSDAEGDLQAQWSATGIAERELLRLVDKYGRGTITNAFAEVQNYVERAARARIAELPDGVWETEDYADFDPKGEEGLVQIKVKMEIKGDQIHFDLNGAHKSLATIFNATFGCTVSALFTATKTFFPDLPLNSGLYRVITFDLGPLGTVINAAWPSAVAASVCGPFEKLANSIFELWSQIIPERALACSYNLEYLLIGGRDKRVEGEPMFMWYDWMVGGWGGRNGRDGAGACAPVFGVRLASQPLEGQERLAPVRLSCHEFAVDSAGPGEFRGGLGVIKGVTMTAVEGARASYACDRARSITWGINGGLPSMPQGAWLNPGTDRAEYLGAVFAGRDVHDGENFTRPAAGGGGHGDPLLRDPDAVLEDVADEVVTIERAVKDYGVVVRPVDVELAEYEVDLEATLRERRRIAQERHGQLEADPEAIAERFRAGELDELDLVRQYGVILDWGPGTVLPRTTEQFRAMLQWRMVPHWKSAGELGL